MYEENFCLILQISDDYLFFNQILHFFISPINFSPLYLYSRFLFLWLINPSSAFGLSIHTWSQWTLEPTTVVPPLARGSILVTVLEETVCDVSGSLREASTVTDLPLIRQVPANNSPFKKWVFSDSSKAATRSST